MDQEQLKHEHHKHHKHHSKKHRNKVIRRTVITIFLVLLVAVGGYGFWVFNTAKNKLDDSYKSAGEKQAARSIVSDKKPLNVLLLGVDTGAFGRNYQGRSDTMIIATVNPAKKRTTLTSIPRDTMAELVGTKTYDFERINAAYQRGGAPMALKSISELLNVPLEYYVTINMGGMEKIVDSVGGVDVNVPFNFTEGDYSFKKGSMHLNGKQALAYARMRHQDPRSDYGRQDRQREVIAAVIKAAISTRSLTNFQDILGSISKNMVTNLSFDDMVAVFTDYRQYGKTIKNDYVQGAGALWGDAMVQIASTKELQRVSDNLRTESGLDKATLNNETTYQNKMNVEKNAFVFGSSSNQQDFKVFER